MEPGESMPNSQGFSNNTHPEPIDPIAPIGTYFFKNLLISPSHLRLRLPKGLFPVRILLLYYNDILILNVVSDNITK